MSWGIFKKSSKLISIVFSTAYIFISLYPHIGKQLGVNSEDTRIRKYLLVVWRTSAYLQLEICPKKIDYLSFQISQKDQLSEYHKRIMEIGIFSNTSKINEDIRSPIEFTITFEMRNKACPGRMHFQWSSIDEQNTQPNFDLSD